MNKKEIKTKILQELKLALRYGRGIKQPELHRMIGFGKNNYYLEVLTELIENRIIFLFAPWIMLNPDYSKTPVEEIVLEENYRFMSVSSVRGVKDLNDKIIEICGIPITIETLCKVLVLMWNNEDILYPPPKGRGSQMLKDLIDEIYEKREVTNELLMKYKIKPRV